MGRPKLAIDWEQFEKLCQIQATLMEMASFLGCSEDTIERRCKEEHDCTFAELYKRKSAGGKISIRRKQMQVALAGNTTMLIWLGKQYLGQTDKQEVTGKDGAPVTGPTPGCVVDFSTLGRADAETLRDIIKRSATEHGKQAIGSTETSKP